MAYSINQPTLTISKHNWPNQHTKVASILPSEAGYTGTCNARQMLINPNK